MNRELLQALRPVAARVRLRHLLHWLGAGLLIGLLGGAAIALAGRAFGQPDPILGPLLWLAVSACGALAAALCRLPGPLAAARAADALGLAERVTSALHANAIGHPAASLLTTEAVGALATANPAGIGVWPRGRRWLALPVAVAALLAALLAPLPGLGDATRRAAEARAVADARQAVEAVEATLPPAAPQPIARATAEELRALERELNEARTAAEAARALERSQERLAGLPNAEDYAAKRALDALASTWSGRSDLGALAAALSRYDSAAVERAAAELADRAEGMTPEQRQSLQRALQSGANAARDVPALAQSLRQAASAAGSRSASKDGEGTASAEGAASAGSAMAGAASALAQSAAQASGLRAAQSALSSLGQARAGLCPPGSQSALAAGAPSSAAASAAAAGAGASGTSSSGSGSGSAGSAPGNGGSTASSSGSGSAGSGTGAGIGSGGGPSTGQPGAPNAGATTGLGGGQSGSKSPTGYDRVYAPSLLGGEGGPQVQAPGDTAGAAGQGVELPQSPLELGAARPYSEVFAQYQASARQALARQALPPALQSMVQRYFSSIEPGSGER